MKKTALNFICKNESHVIKQMLQLAAPITDLIVAVDTGSTDNTKELIYSFGRERNIPTYVFDRPFDNFASSRQYAMDCLQKIAGDLGWDKKASYGFWFDCDEKLIVEPSFDKQQLELDLYYILTYVDGLSYTKTFLFKLSQPFYWEGPAHESIMWDDETITTGIVDSMHIIYEKTGASWNGDLVNKYIGYGRLIENYINEGHTKQRWFFYAGDSYMAAGGFAKDPRQKEELLLKAQDFYLKTLECKNGPFEDYYISRLRLASIDQQMNKPWGGILDQFLDAFSYDPMRSEPIRDIIEHYLEAEEWEQAYIFASFGYKVFHGNHRMPKYLRFFHLDESLYNWRMLYYYYISAFYTGRKETYQAAFKELRSLMKECPQYFTKEHANNINATSPSILSVLKVVKRFRVGRRASHLHSGGTSL